MGCGETSVLRRLRAPHEVRGCHCDRSAGKREPADGQIAGVVALAPGDAPGTLDLNKLFIEPRHIRGSVGRALFALAVAEARRRTADDFG